MKSFLRAAVLLAGTAMLTAAAQAQSFEGPEFEAAVKAYIVANPEVIIDSVNGYVERQKLAERAAEDEQFLNSAPAFLDAANLPVLGNPEGSVTMVYVLDAACTYCRQLTPILEQVIEQNPELKIVQRWVPFLTPSSEYAARLAFLVHERFPDKYHDFYSDLMKQTGQLSNDVVDGVLAQLLGDEQMLILRSDAMDGSDSMRVASLVQQNLDLAATAGVSGTPFLYAEGSGAEGIIRGSMPVQVLQAAIDRAKAAADEGAF